MKKLLIHFLSIFIPNKEIRHQWRKTLMTPSCQIYGTGNKILVEENGKVKEFQPKKGWQIYIKGHNNTVLLHFPILAKNNTINIQNSNNTHIEIGHSPFLTNCYIDIYNGNSNYIKIGKGVTIGGATFRLNSTGNIIIGNDCMLADNILFRADDGHAILDKTTGEIINRPSGPITIGDHCWIGANVLLSKNARLPANTIVGMGSLVTKAFSEEYTILVGSPASVKKRGIIWDRNSIYILEQKRKNTTNGSFH